MEILIAEDDYISRNLLKRMLTDMGHQVVETENGRQAWALLRKRPIRLLVTDWMMPEMDGLELCRNIRNTTFDEYIYVIVLTAKDRKKDLVEVFQSGADDYIPKPFDPEELKARVLTGLRVIDLEERHKRMQNSLIDSQNDLLSIVDALPEQIVVINSDFRVVTVNQAFCQTLDVEPIHLVGEPITVHAVEGATRTFLSTVIELARETFDTGRAGDIRHTFYNEPEPARQRQIVSIPMVDETAQVAQVLIVGTEIQAEDARQPEVDGLLSRLAEIQTAMARKEGEEQALRRQLELSRNQMLQSEKMAAIGQLSAGVAHEINNPTGFVDNNLKALSEYLLDLSTMITAYRGLCETLRDAASQTSLGNNLMEKLAAALELEQRLKLDFLLEDITGLVSDCREGTRRIKKIVADLKRFVHPGEDTLQRVDINEGLTTTLNVVNHEIKYRAVVETELAPLPMVKGYPQQLNQVFMNLLVNAAQAIEKNGRIEVKSRCCDGWAEVSIRDTGCGIAAENLSKIFEPFFTTKEAGKGTGLGLYLVAKIIEKHQGTIDVQSKPGEGTTFTIRLPAESHMLRRSP
jgi:signal transduction histidine kinase